jgi:uncharacterized membrane protein
MEPNNQVNVPVGGGENKTNRKLWSVIAYIIFFIPLLTEAKNDPLVKFHVKQGLILLITSVVLNTIVHFLPLSELFGALVGLFIFILWIIGILNALGEKEKELPLIGQFGKQFNF